MTDDKIKEFRKELSQLLDKYNVSIGFTCGENSDTHGLYNDYIVVRENGSGQNIVEADDWWLTKSDLL